MILTNLCPRIVHQRSPGILLVTLIALMGSLSARSQVVTAVQGASWLEHLHRPFDQTSMGKSTGVYGPRAPSPRDWESRRPALKISSNFTGQSTKMWGADLFRLKCQSCHGPRGTGAPPEINSVLDPVRATSPTMYIARMKKLGMDVSMKDAAVLAKQAEATLLKRLHNGGTDMPSPNPYLTDAEVRSLFAYLRQLAGIPGAEKHQVPVVETPLRVGEHIVKSTCHICHTAVGRNPTPAEIMEGAIPPLSTLTSRLSVNEFVIKVTAGSPVLEGAPAIPLRGHMPVFTYLSPDEAADAYLYLSLYPPKN